MCMIVCVRVFVCAYMCGGGRVCVKRTCEGVSRVLCDVVVKRDWASATLRRTARAFNPRATRSASARRHLVSTPQSDARTHTLAADTRRRRKKIGNNNNKITRRFSPSSDVFVRVSFLYVFFLFFLSFYFGLVPFTYYK